MSNVAALAGNGVGVEIGAGDDNGACCACAGNNDWVCWAGAGLDNDRRSNEACGNESGDCFVGAEVGNVDDAGNSDSTKKNRRMYYLCIHWKFDWFIWSNIMNESCVTFETKV